jgi:hypothetical protein
MIWHESPIIIGVTSIICAIIIAVGEYNKPSQPNGPDRDRFRYTIKPTTTGGSPIRAFTMTTSVFLKIKLLMARIAPKGKPIKQDRTNEVKLTRIERDNISSKSESRLNISWKAVEKDSEKVCIFYQHDVPLHLSPMFQVCEVWI